MLYKILIALLLFSIAGYIYGEFGPYYQTVVVNVPFDFTSTEELTQEFTVEKEWKYGIGFFRDWQQESPSIERLNPPPLNLFWQVKEGGEVVAEGRRLESHEEWQYFDGGLDNIGYVTASPGRTYTIGMRAEGAQEEWERIRYRLRVDIHPADYENYLVIQIVSLLLGAIALFLLVPIALADGLNKWMKSRKSKPDEPA